MRETNGRRFTTFTLLLAWACFGSSGCGDIDPAGPPPPERIFAAAPSALEVRLQAVDPAALPSGAQIRWGTSTVRTGRAGGWHAWLPAPALPSPLRLEPWEGEQSFHHYSVVAPSSGSLSLPLVPHRKRFGHYAHALALLDELARPLNGPVLRRWPVATLRVALPQDDEDTWLIDYATVCAEAIDRWNCALGAEVLIPVPATAEAEVIATTYLHHRLAWTRLSSSDELGHPLRMQLHVSPRYFPGTERYALRTYLHELGHCLGLWGHSQEEWHVMNGTVVRTDQLHPDEVQAARWLWRMPDGTNLDGFQLEESDVELSPPRAWPWGKAGRTTRCSDSMAAGTGAFHPAWMQESRHGAAGPPTDDGP